jgi:hypothetical protein
MSTFKQIIEQIVEGVSDTNRSDPTEDHDIGLNKLITSVKPQNYNSHTTGTEVRSRGLHPDAANIILAIRQDKVNKLTHGRTGPLSSNMVDNSFNNIKNKPLSDNDLFHIFTELHVAKSDHLDHYMNKVLTHPNAGPATKAAYAMHTIHPYN